MGLLFPFKNLSINSFLYLLSEDGIKNFIDHVKNGTEEDDPFFFDSFTSSIEHFQNSLPDFENELLQTIDTTNQKTIDYYFFELKHNIEYIQSKIDRSAINSAIKDWNNKESNRFEDLVEKESVEYFKSEDRKRKHLEEYETYLHSFLDNKLVKVKKVNHNYYCIESQPKLITSIKEVEYYIATLEKLFFELYDKANKYIFRYDKGEIKSNIENISFSKPVVFVEGDHDISFILKAAELLGETKTLDSIELRERGGFNNLDKIWRFYKENNWETIPQKKILLYDCDTEKKDEDSTYIYKRIIPAVSSNIIYKGIENLFPRETVDKAIAYKKAFIDFKTISGTKRGEEYSITTAEVNPDEKKNFCKWVCDNASVEDFKNFNAIFEIIKTTIDI